MGCAPPRRLQDLQGGKHTQYINRVLQTGQMAGGGRVRNISAVHRTGEAVPVDLSIAMCTSGPKEETLFVGFLRWRGNESRQQDLLAATFPPEIVKKLVENPQGAAPRPAPPRLPADALAPAPALPCTRPYPYSWDC